MRALLAVDAPSGATSESDEAWLTRVIELDGETPNADNESTGYRSRVVALILLVPEGQARGGGANTGVESGD